MSNDIAIKDQPAPQSANDQYATGYADGYAKCAMNRAASDDVDRNLRAVLAASPIGKAANPCNNSNGSSDTGKTDTVVIPRSELVAYSNQAFEQGVIEGRDSGGGAIRNAGLEVAAEHFDRNSNLLFWGSDAADAIRTLKSATTSTIKADHINDAVEMVATPAKSYGSIDAPLCSHIDELVASWVKGENSTASVARRIKAREELENAMRPLLAAVLPQEAKAVAPEGWKLVPIKPTEAMHAAAVRTIVRCNGNDDFPPRVYAAMLDAALNAPVPRSNAAPVAVAGEAKPEPTFPEMPPSVFKHQTLGPMWDRLEMHFYAQKHADAMVKLLSAVPAKLKFSAEEIAKVQQAFKEKGFKPVLGEAKAVAPEGWKLVPINMTEEMEVAFAEQWFSKRRCIDDPETQDAYAAMLDAVLNPPITLSDAAPVAEALPVAAEKGDLETLMTQHRVGVTPEYDGPWHAKVYGEEAEAEFNGEGATPTEAVLAAIAASMAGEKS